MKVLVLGSTGFVGKYVLKELEFKNIEFISLVRKKPEKDIGNYEILDFFDKKALKNIIEKYNPDALIYLIGILVQSKDNTFEKAHYLIPKNLYEIASKINKNIKVVHMSALGTDVKAPSLYHQSKYMGEKALIGSGLSYTIFRPSLIIGPEQKLFRDMYEITKYLRVMALPGLKDYYFQPVDVRDIAFLFGEALSNKALDNKIFEICGETIVSFKELLEDIFKYFKRKILFARVPKALLYVNGLILEKIMSNPLLTSDQILMMYKNNTCDSSKESVFSILNKKPIPYKESLDWALNEFLKLYIYK